MKNLVLLLISMSAAGTLSFILYLALSTVFDNYISVWMFKILSAALFSSVSIIKVFYLSSIL